MLLLASVNDVRSGISLRNTETPLGLHTDQGPQGRSQYDDQGVYCGPSTASELFLIFTTQLYQYLSCCFFLFALVSDEPEVFLPKYSHAAILHAAQFLRVYSKCVQPHYSSLLPRLPMCLGLFVEVIFDTTLSTVYPECILVN